MQKTNFSKFSLQLRRIFFLKLKFFENFCIQPTKFIFFTCFKHQKWKLHEGLTLLTSSQTKWRAVKVAVGWFHPHPPLYRSTKKPTLIRVKHLPKRTLKQMIHHLKIIFYDEHDCLSHFTKQNRISLLGLIGLTLRRLTSERPCQSWGGAPGAPLSILALEPL